MNNVATPGVKISPVIDSRAALGYNHAVFNGVYMRLLLSLILLLCVASTAWSAVDLTLKGRGTVRIEDVYQQQGIPYIAIEDALGAVGLSGHWNSVKHTFRIRSKRGWAEISPASGYMKLGEDYYPIKDKPRFIDGRLRVTDAFILNQLAMLTGRSIHISNLDPETDNFPESKQGALEQLFAFLLNKKKPSGGPLIRVIAIDPGHGGLDSGVIAEDGYKEKQLNLEVAKLLAKKLKMQLGVPIYLSRDGDYELTTEQRLQAASREDVDLWLLLHAQASFSDEANGVTLFVRPEDNAIEPLAGDDEPAAVSDSFQLAQQLEATLRDSQIKVNGIFATSRLSLGRGNLPTVLIELGYLSHAKERERLQQPDYQNRIVEALYTGIKSFAKMNKERVDNVTE